MSLTEPLQTTVPVLGRAVEINTDFRRGILFETLMMDTALSDAEKCERAVRLWFDERIEETPEAIEQALLGAMAFWKRETGQTDRKDAGEETKPMERPVINYEIDADLIHAAFLSAYGIDLMREDLHWHEFLSLLASLPDDTRLMKVIGHRCAKITPDMPEEQKEEIRRMHKIFDLPVPKAEEEAREEALLYLLGENDDES